MKCLADQKADEITANFNSLFKKTKDVTLYNISMLYDHKIQKYVVFAPKHISMLVIENIQSK